MANLGQDGQSMPLSNMKRQFRTQFRLELSETALGYAKLSECLKDPRLQDLCEVRLQGQGYTVAPSLKPLQELPTCRLIRAELSHRVQEPTASSQTSAYGRSLPRLLGRGQAGPGIDVVAKEGCLATSL